MTELAEARSKPEIALVAIGLGLAATLAAIGIASGEVLRHLVQAGPVLVCALVAMARPPWARWALGPVFAFWLMISVFILLFLAGLPSPASGSFNLAEQTLAGALGVLAMAGFLLFPRIERPLPIGTGALVAAAFAALQIVAFRISLLPAIAHR